MASPLRFDMSVNIESGMVSIKKARILENARYLHEILIQTQRRNSIDLGKEAGIRENARYLHDTWNS